MHVFIGLMVFEAITNLRVPLVLAKLKSANGRESQQEQKCFTFNIESERLLRVVVAVFLIVSYVLYPETIWFFPWFVAAMLFLAGITNICPMVMMFQLAGFR